MKIILSHGRGSSKNSKEMFRLARTAEVCGFSTYRVNDIDTEDPELRAKRLTDIVGNEHVPLILVGFSMGGYTSMLAATVYPEKIKGLFLLAPALYTPRYAVKDYPIIHPTEIIHGWDDDIILYEHSLRYARHARCTLHLTDASHTFLKPHELDLICNRFQAFLQPFQNKTTDY